MFSDFILFLVLWINQLRKDSLEHVNKLVAPGKMLSGRGTALVHLNDIVFRVMKGLCSFFCSLCMHGFFFIYLLDSLSFVFYNLILISILTVL